MVSVVGGSRTAGVAGLRTTLQLLGPSTGGIRIHVASLAEGLGERGVAAPIVGPAGVMDAVGAQAGDVAVPASANPLALASARRSLRSWREPAQLVHAHGLKAAWCAIGGRPRRPLVITVHNRVIDESAGRSARAQRILERRVLAGADRVIALTTQMASELAEFVDRDRIAVVLPASPPPVVTEARSEVRARLGIGEDAPMVVAVARLHPQKDLPTLLRAWESVHARNPEAQLVVVGEGPQRAELEALASSLELGGSAHLIGARPRAVNEIAAGDVAVMTSIWEGAALVLAETTQLGVPMVSTPTGLAPDLLDGDAGGVIVPKRDPGATADALCHMLDDPDAAAALGARGADRARECFDPGKSIEAVMAVYREVIE